MSTYIPKKLNNEIEIIFQKNKELARIQDAKISRYDRLNEKANRRDDVKEFYRILWQKKYKIEYATNISPKHFSVAFDFYKENGQPLSTLDGKLNNLRLFCEWIGKKGMVDQWLSIYLKANVKENL